MNKRIFSAALLLATSGCGQAPTPVTTRATPSIAVTGDGRQVVTHDGKPATAPVTREVAPPTEAEKAGLQKIAATLKGDTIDGHWERGMAYLVAAEDMKVTAAYTEAAKDFSWILAKQPKHLGALGNRGMAYARSGQLDLAIVDFKTACDADPSNGEAWGRYGSLLAKTGKDKEAIAAYDKAVAAGGPAAEGAQFNRANAYLRLGDKDKASKDFQALVSAKNPRVAEGAKMNLDAMK